MSEPPSTPRELLLAEILRELVWITDALPYTSHPLQEDITENADHDTQDTDRPSLSGRVDLSTWWILCYRRRAIGKYGELRFR